MINTWISHTKSRPEIAAGETEREIEDLLWFPSEVKPDETPDTQTADQAFLRLLIWTALGILCLGLLVDRSPF